MKTFRENSILARNHATTKPSQDYMQGEIINADTAEFIFELEFSKNVVRFVIWTCILQKVVASVILRYLGEGRVA